MICPTCGQQVPSATFVNSGAAACMPIVHVCTAPNTAAAQQVIWFPVLNA